jgi:gas vesicle protein
MGFIIGCFIGAIVMFVVMMLLRGLGESSKQVDEMYERELKKQREKYKRHWDGWDGTKPISVDRDGMQGFDDETMKQVNEEADRVIEQIRKDEEGRDKPS